MINNLAKKTKVFVITRTYFYSDHELSVTFSTVPSLFSWSQREKRENNNIIVQTMRMCDS